MDHHQSHSITDLLAEYFHATGVENTLFERQLIANWPDVVSPQAARLTNKLEIRDGVLYAYVQSAALKAELFMCRRTLVQKLNDSVGGHIIKDIRILG